MIIKNYPKRKRQVILNYILPRNIDWSTLNPLETKIIKMRWGIDPYTHKHNHQEIAAATNLTVPVVSTTERKTIKRIRDVGN